MAALQLWYRDRGGARDELEKQSKKVNASDKEADWVVLQE